MKELTRVKTKLLRAKRGVSPVISTVILVAVAITVAVAVAYWMGGIAGQYTRFEKLEIVNAYAVKETDQWSITIKVKNTGSTDATFEGVYINGIPISDYANCTETISTKTLASGDEGTYSITIDALLHFSSATTIEIKLHTAAGQDYPQHLTLP